MLIVSQAAGGYAGVTFSFSELVGGPFTAGCTFSIVAISGYTFTATVPQIGNTCYMSSGSSNSPITSGSMTIIFSPQGRLPRGT